MTEEGLAFLVFFRIDVPLLNEGTCPYRETSSPGPRTELREETSLCCLWPVELMLSVRSVVRVIMFW